MATVLAAHRGTWHSVDRYIALTSAIAAHLREYGIPDDRISVKPNAVPDPGPAGAGAPNGSGFLFAARLSDEKGLGPLLDAWRRHPDGAAGPLRIAGDGPLRGLAEAAAAERSDVEYLGQRDAAGMRAAIRAAACVVATPTWHDVLPTIALEAMSFGRPVLATAMGGLPYLVGVDQDTPVTDGAGAVRAGQGGWVVEPTVDGVAAGLAVAAAGAPGAGGSARERYLGSFSPEVITGRLIKIYTSVTEAAR
jgi:glycosyltransferase involved in cell wall biosynthesis